MKRLTEQELNQVHAALDRIEDTLGPPSWRERASWYAPYVVWSFLAGIVIGGLWI